MPDSHTVAWNEGWHAQQLGTRRQDNPYYGTQEEEDWYAGWDAHAQASTGYSLIQKKGEMS